MDRIAQLREMVDADPDDGLGRYMLGRELLAAGRAAEAAAELQQAVRLTPDHTASHRELGNALAAAGHLELARAAYETGMAVAARTGDLQTGKEMQVFLSRLLRKQSDAS